METRAPLALIGSLVVAALAAAFVFVYWLNNSGGLGKRDIYEVEFTNSVSGLLKGAAVLFNGIRVGEVSDLRLDPSRARRVIAKVAVAQGTPVRMDTHVGLDFQGLTGVPVIALEGRSDDFGDRPVHLVADENAGISMTQAARDALRRLEKLLSENADSFRNTMTGLEAFATALGRNSDHVDSIVAGIEKMTGGGPAPAPLTIFDLNPPTAFPPRAQNPTGQLTVAEPTAVIAMDTQKIIVVSQPEEHSDFANVRWSDSLPKLVQARILQTFENADMAQSVIRPIDGVSPSLTLMIDIRHFDISAAPSLVTRVELFARIVREDGKIVAARLFKDTEEVSENNHYAAAAAFDATFGNVVTELVTWAAENF